MEYYIYFLLIALGIVIYAEYEKINSVKLTYSVFNTALLLSLVINIAQDIHLVYSVCILTLVIFTQISLLHQLTFIYSSKYLQIAIYILTIFLLFEHTSIHNQVSYYLGYLKSEPMVQSTFLKYSGICVLISATPLIILTIITGRLSDIFRSDIYQKIKNVYQLYDFLLINNDIKYLNVKLEKGLPLLKLYQILSKNTFGYTKLILVSFDNLEEFDSSIESIIKGGYYNIDVNSKKDGIIVNIAILNDFNYVTEYYKNFKFNILRSKGYVVDFIDFYTLTKYGVTHYEYERDEESYNKTSYNLNISHSGFMTRLFTIFEKCNLSDLGQYKSHDEILTIIQNHHGKN